MRPVLNGLITIGEAILVALALPVVIVVLGTPVVLVVRFLLEVIQAL